MFSQYFASKKISLTHIFVDTLWDNIVLVQGSQRGLKKYLDVDPLGQ